MLLLPSRIILSDYTSAFDRFVRLSSCIFLPRFVLFRQESEETGLQLRRTLSLFMKLVAPESDTLSSVSEK